MKVILSIESIRPPLTGIGRYTFELAKALQQHPDISELYFFSHGYFTEELPNEEAKNRVNTLVKNKFYQNLFLRKSYHCVMPLIKKMRLRNYSDALYHGPNFSVPSFPGRSFVTFHDLSIFLYPEYHPLGRVQTLQKEIEKTLKRVDALITDSEYTRQEAARYFNWPLEKIFTIPLAASSDYRKRKSEELISILKNHQLAPNQYTLFVGTIEPRKNIETLLTAYSLLPASLRRRWPLVLCGSKGWKSERIHEKIKKAEEEGWVKYLGFVSNQQLPLLFSGAKLFIYPSVYEGFGLPVLEAMQSGVPVICSNCSSLPEVVGDAASLFDPNDVGYLHFLLQQGLEDKQWREQAIEHGLARAALFSWTRCAKETISVYKTVY